MDQSMPFVMVDDGSALNICPLKILPHLSLTEEMLQKSSTIIRAYDNSKRTILGTFETEVEVQGVMTKTVFTVIDIPVTFSLLLGMPWIHALGGVSSTLHQKIKLPQDGKTVTIEAHRPSVMAALVATEPPFTGL